MFCLVLQAYWRLILFDLYLRLGPFRALYTEVHAAPINGSNLSKSSEQICAAVDIACIWYWKQVLCLQRSAATTCLLKSYGLPAEMILGVQQTPFKAHAWVEIDGRVVNDKPYTANMYAVLDRC